MHQKLPLGYSVLLKRPPMLPQPITYLEILNALPILWTRKLAFQCEQHNIIVYRVDDEYNSGIRLLYPVQCKLYLKWMTTSEQLKQYHSYVHGLPT